MTRGAHALVAGLLVVACSYAGAARAERTIEIETRVGFGLTKFTGDDPDAKLKTGFAGTIAVHVPVNEWLTVEPEMSYAMKGTSYGEVTDPLIEGTTYVGTFEQLYSMDYVEMPVLLRAHTSGALVRPAIVAGPVLGWKVVEKFTLNGPGTADPYGTGHSAKALDFGLAAGLGLDIGPADHCLTLEARYTSGLSNFLKPEAGGSLKNSDMRVQVGWKKIWTP